SLFNTVATL
nr:Chain C, HIV P17 [Human immunodeficiency virus]2V2X_F Chain F, HIV P17 [Human immunodeficiency virus]